MRSSEGEGGERVKIQYTVTINDRDVERITPENLRAYALRTGWERMPDSRDDCTHWKKTHPTKNELLIFGIVGPNFNYTHAFADAHAVQSFAEVEQRDPRDIVRDIVGGASEIVT
jgi:hypothetical protein